MSTRPDGLPHEGKIVFSLGPNPSPFDVCTVTELATALALVYPKDQANRIAEREAAFGLDRSGERIARRVTLCWEGARGASLDLTLERELGLPRLHAITEGPTGAESVRIAGRPMLLERDHPAAPGVPCAANIQGFPRDDLTLLAQIFAPSRAERDELLRCVMTLSAAGEAA